MLCVEGMLAVRVAGRWRGGESPGRLAWVRVAPSSWCQGGPATVTLPCWCHCWLCWAGGTDPYRGAGPALAASGSPRLVPKPALIHILPVNSKLRVLPHSVSLLPPPRASHKFLLPPPTTGSSMEIGMRGKCLLSLKRQQVELA